MFHDELQAEGSGFETRSHAHLRRTPSGLQLSCERCGAQASHHELTRSEDVHTFKRLHTRCQKPSS